MGYYIRGKLDRDKSFVRYIYGDIRDELKNLWKTMLTLLGMLGVAIGYVLKGAGNTPSFWGYVIVTQLIWLFAMIEILLFSNYLSKHKFLMEIEEAFEPSLKEETKEKKGETKEDTFEKVPFWQIWINHFFSRSNGYTISVLSITAWSFLAFMVAAVWAGIAWDAQKCNKSTLGIILVYLLLILELIVAAYASLHTAREYRNLETLKDLWKDFKSFLKSRLRPSS